MDNVLNEDAAHAFHTVLSAIDAINRRSSVRSYSAEEVDPAVIRYLLEAAVRAPTAMHSEPWGFVVIQDAQKLRQLSDQAKPLFLSEMQKASFDSESYSLSYFEQSAFNVFYNAGTLIVICGKATQPMASADCWLAAENLMLAACTLGLGSCVIGSAIAALNCPEVKSEFCIPPDMQAIVPIIIGIPDTPPLPSSRKEPQILFWKES